MDDPKRINFCAGTCSNCKCLINKNEPLSHVPGKDCKIKLKQAAKEDIEKFIEDNAQLFADLAEGPHGEYHHGLEARLKEVLEENQKLKEFVEEVAKDPYEDSNIKDLFYTLNKRAKKVLND